MNRTTAPISSRRPLVDGVPSLPVEGSTVTPPAPTEILAFAQIGADPPANVAQAVLLSTCPLTPAPTVVLTVIVANCPGLSCPTAAVTTLPLATAVPTVLVADVTVNPAGSVSLTLIPWRIPPVAFVTMIVNVTAPPSVVLGVLTVLVIVNPVAWPAELPLAGEASGTVSVAVVAFTDSGPLDEVA